MFSTTGQLVIIHSRSAHLHARTKSFLPFHHSLPYTSIPLFFFPPTSVFPLHIFLLLSSFLSLHLSVPPFFSPFLFLPFPSNFLNSSVIVSPFLTFSLIVPPLSLHHVRQWWWEKKSSGADPAPRDDASITLTSLQTSNKTRSPPCPSSSPAARWRAVNTPCRPRYFSPSANRSWPVHATGGTFHWPARNSLLRSHPPTNPPYFQVSSRKVSFWCNSEITTALENNT